MYREIMEDVPTKYKLPRQVKTCLKTLEKFVQKMKDLALEWLVNLGDWKILNILHLRNFLLHYSEEEFESHIFFHLSWVSNHRFPKTAN